MLQTEGSELQNNEQLERDILQFHHKLSESVNQTKILPSSQIEIEFNDDLFFSNPLMDSTELYRQIVDTSNEGIWVSDLNSRLIFSNKKGAAILGYTREEIIGRSVFDFVSQEGNSLAEFFFERRKQGHNDQYEQKLVRKDGSILWVTITASPIRDQSGNVVGTLGMLNDISQRKIAEMDLMKSEEKFAAAFRTSPNCLAISDISTGILLDVNDTFLSVFELTREQVIGKNTLDLNIYAHPDDRTELINILEAEGRVVNHDLKIKTSTGKEKSIRVSIEKLPLDDYNVMLTTIQDITELTTIQSNLRQSEELYRNLVDSANSIILRWRADGKIVYMNDYGLRYFGYSPGEIIGQNAGILIPEVESTGKNLANLANQIIQNSGKYIQLENENLRKNGERVWISWTNKAIGKGKDLEILTIGNDISHLKKAKEALKTEHAKLQAIIQNMGIGVIVTDGRGNIITLNTAALKIHGYQTNEEYEARKDKYFEDFELRTFAGEKIPFEDWPNLQAIGGNFVKSYEAILFNRRTNSTKFLSYNVSPLYDDHHKLKYTIFNITDLSEIQKINVRLSETELRYTKLFNNKTSAISHNRIVFDNAGQASDVRILQVNDTYAKITGIKKEDVEGKTLLELFPNFEDHHPGLINQYGQISREGGEINLECFDEQVGRWLSVYAYSPKLNEFTAIFNDITERKNIEEEIISKASETETILSCIPDAVIVFDSNARIIRTNTAAQKILNYPEIYNSLDPIERINTFFKVWNEDGKQIAPEKTPGYRSAVNGEVVINEVILLEAFGEKKWYSMNAVPWSISGKHSGAVLSLNDITAERNSAQLIREKEERFRALADNMSQMGWIADREGKIIWFNKRWYDFTGLSIEDVYQGKYLEIHHPDFLEYMTKSYGESIKSGNPWEATLPMKSKTGEYRWFLARALPIHDDKGNINLWFGTNTDITEQRLNEEMLQKKNLELQKAKEKAEESVRFKNAFIANISHEIRTPMSGILGFADLLKSPDLSSESKNSYIETIISSGERMLGIINDLIYISKIEAGQLELYKDITDLHKLMDELKVFFQPEAKKKKLDLKVTKALPPDKILTETDKTKLSQVLTNLIKNAIKYTATGYIEVGCRFQGSYYIFNVKDTGIGIKEEHQLNIFERFKQGEVSTEALEGLGLGLAISKSIVDALGGTIWVESEPKLGSTFYFTIPHKEQVYAAKPNLNNNIEMNTRLPECEVLIAEDEEFIYYFLNQFLSKKNIKTLHASNGEEAINMVIANPNIQLVLMDTRMPVLNGLEATKRIKKLKPELPIIALSAFASSLDVQQTIKAGCVDYIVKPFNKEIVMQKILMYVGEPGDKSFD